MRASEIYETAVEDLKNRLPKLKSHTYDSIDNLMQDISFRHRITGKKLHDLFVHKYGHTPDTWIKKLKDRLEEQGVAEGSTDLVQIEYWQQETMESGRWVKTKPMPRATAEKIVNSFERGEIVDVEQGVAEGAPELLKKEMPLHRHAEKLLAQNGVNKDDPEYHHHLGNTIKHLRQFGNIDLINKQGVAEGLNEFAPDGFNGGDDDEGFSPEIAKMAQEDGFTKGVSLADGATLERAMTINYWHSQHGGMYKQYFAKGFKEGRMNKVNHDNKQYNLNLKLMKDGSIRHGEQGVAEGWTKLPSGDYQNSHTGVRTSKPPAKKKRGEKTGAEWDAIEKAKKEQGVAEDWNKVNKKDKTSGMSQKAVNAYRRENPGSKLKTAVTTKPSKLKPGSKAAKRRKSFCARMGGNKGPMKKPNGKPTPKALALRRWNCESVEELQELVMLAEQKINEAKNLKRQAAIAIAKKKSVTEMDKSQTPPGRDGGNDSDAGKKEYTAKTTTAKKVTKDGEKILNKIFKDTPKKKVSESVDNTDQLQQIKDFINWSMKTLNMQKPYPKFTLSRNTKQAQQGHHTGLHQGDRIWVYIENRNLVDIFRTIFHELVHHRQDQLNMIKDGDSYPGSPIEALADMMAGKYIKIYGKDHPEIFQ